MYEVFSSIRLCRVAALSEDWEDAYVHAKKVHEGRPSFNVLDIFTSITWSKRYCEEETRAGPRRGPPFRRARRG